MEQQHEKESSNVRVSPAGESSHRRFSSIEGWKEVANNMYYAAGHGLVNLSTSPDIDGVPNENADVITRQASHTEHDTSMNTSTIQQTDDEGSDPFSTTNDIEGEDQFKSLKDETQTTKAEEPYHVFTPRQRWFVVVIIGAAGLFSGLSSNIYFPALDAIAKDLNVSLQSVSLTITSYLIIQGISPVIWGSFADALGRRPIYIASFAVYITANIVLSFSPNFIILIVFRGLQAAGSASTVSIGNGVIQDITQPAERGSYISFYQAIRNFSIAIGPVLGGALSNSMGFRSIFVFLLILSTVTLGFILVFLPETMRNIAGNGSLRLSGVYRPLIRVVRKEPDYMRDPEHPIKRKQIRVSTFTDPLRLLGQRDILLNLVFGGIIYTVWSMVTSTTTSIFKSAFGLNELLVGLAFLPNGLGTIVGSAIIGKLMNKDFRAAEVTYREQHKLPDDYKIPSKAIPGDFGIEHARLRHLWWVTLLFTLATGVYGFTVGDASLTSRPAWVIVPLMLQFLIAATSNAVFAMNQTMVSDLCPGKGASSTAINNLVRCGLAAVGVAFAETMVGALGPATSFLLLALVVAVCTPMPVVNWHHGPGWRRQRMEKETKKSNDKV
ncbi:major facilitator superfamily domain-containing protein [Pestalotiopsis sp. NC0098]|nr:major facilitator superfamily domain-containing protein [Pestalotiopsis sp. NC0098]